MSILVCLVLEGVQSLHAVVTTPFHRVLKIRPTFVRCIGSLIPYIVCYTLMVGCSLRDLVDVGESTASVKNTVDPGVVKTYAGAVGLYYSTIGDAALAMSSYAQLTGVLTDELRIKEEEWNEIDPLDASDIRTGNLENESTEKTYGQLSKVRISAQQAIGALRLHTSTPSRYYGELYALQGIAEVLLAEGYCSGIPLSQAPFGGGVRYSAGVTRDSLLKHAIAIFDTALSYSDNAPRIATLARIGLARALLNLGDFARAAESAGTVAEGFSYMLSYAPADTNLYFPELGTEGGVRVENREGGNGMVWLAQDAAHQDPRIPMATVTDEHGIVQFSMPLTQRKYSRSITTTFELAGATEGKLIEAEMQLQPASNPNGPWLSTLNALRRSIGLSDTTDPGNERGRVDLLFRERAFWLYLTGHRQGDLRRLIRQYGRTVRTTYPVGPYLTMTSGVVRYIRYEDAVVMSPGPDERKRNTLYMGCFNREP